MALLIYSIVPADAAMTVIHGPVITSKSAATIPSSGAWALDAELWQASLIAESRCQPGLLARWKGDQFHYTGWHVMSSTLPVRIIDRYRTLATQDGGLTRNWAVLTLDVEDCFQTSTMPLNVYCSRRDAFSGALAIGAATTVTVESSLDAAFDYIDANPPAAWPHATPNY